MRREIWYFVAASSALLFLSFFGVIPSIGVGLGFVGFILALYLIGRLPEYRWLAMPIFLVIVGSTVLIPKIRSSFREALPISSEHSEMAWLNSDLHSWKYRPRVLEERKNLAAWCRRTASERARELEEILQGAHGLDMPTLLQVERKTARHIRESRRLELKCRHAIIKDDHVGATGIALPTLKIKDFFGSISMAKPEVSPLALVFFGVFLLGIIAVVAIGRGSVGPNMLALIIIVVAALLFSTLWASGSASSVLGMTTIRRTDPSRPFDSGEYHRMFYNLPAGWTIEYEFHVSNDAETPPFLLPKACRLYAGSPYGTKTVTEWRYGTKIEIPMDMELALPVGYSATVRATHGQQMRLVCTS